MTADPWAAELAAAAADAAGVPDMLMAKLCVQSPAASDLQLLELVCGLEPRTRSGHAFSMSRITLMAEEYEEAK